VPLNDPLSNPRIALSCPAVLANKKRGHDDHVAWPSLRGAVKWEGDAAGKPHGFCGLAKKLNLEGG
jgi:hypothetical protein